MKTLLTTFLALTLAALVNAACPPSLQGFCAIDEAPWVSLRSAGGGQRWVRVGEKFDGFDVELWSANDDAVILRRDGERWAVPFAATSSVNSANETAQSTETAGIRDNLLRLAVRACEYLLEQATDRVAATDLVGSDGALQRLESVAGETYADLSFSVGRDGLEMVVDGRTVPLMPADDTIVVRVGPTHSLAAIGRQLHLPLARLEALNPRLGPERFSDWTSVRLQ